MDFVREEFLDGTACPAGGGTGTGAGAGGGAGTAGGTGGSAGGMGSGSPGSTRMAGGTAGRDVEDIYKDIGIGGTAVVVSTVCGIFLRIFQVLFLHDFPAFDHAAAAVWAVILTFLAGGAAAGAVIKILDFGADDLLPGRRAGGTAKTETLPDPLNKTYDCYNGHCHKSKKCNQAEDEILPANFFTVIGIPFGI